MSDSATEICYTEPPTETRSVFKESFLTILILIVFHHKYFTFISNLAPAQHNLKNCRQSIINFRISCVMRNIKNKHRYLTTFRKHSLQKPMTYTDPYLHGGKVDGGFKTTKTRFKKKCLSFFEILRSRQDIFEFNSNQYINLYLHKSIFKQKLNLHNIWIYIITHKKKQEAVRFCLLSIKVK